MPPPPPENELLRLNSQKNKKKGDWTSNSKSFLKSFVKMTLLEPKIASHVPAVNLKFF